MTRQRHQPSRRKFKLAAQRRLRHVHSVHWRTQQVIRSTPLLAQPNPHSRRSGNTNVLMQNVSRQSNQVQPLQAVKKQRRTYVLISRQGKRLGWIDQRDLKPVREYLLPKVYVSQFWPSRVADACEVASLKTALSTQSKALNVSLQTMVQRIPRTNNPNRGYTHNPYQYGTHATIYPDAMVKIARRYGAQAKNITGASRQEFIREVTHGRAVVFEGPYMMKKPGSDHDLVIIGYKPHYFYVMDPFARHRYSRRGTWVSISRMMMLYNRPFRHQRALVVY